MYLARAFEPPSACRRVSRAHMAVGTPACRAGVDPPSDEAPWTGFEHCEVRGECFTVAFHTCAHQTVTIRVLAYDKLNSHTATAHCSAEGQPPTVVPTAARPSRRICAMQAGWGACAGGGSEAVATVTLAGARLLRPSVGGTEGRYRVVHTRIHLRPWAAEWICDVEHHRLRRLAVQRRREHPKRRLAASEDLRGGGERPQV